jgi:peroxiredoxin
VAATPPDVDAAARTAARVPRRVDRGTWAVVVALALVGAAWLVWARLTAAPGAGLSWGPLDSILAASADRQIAQPAPTFALTDSSGAVVALEDLRGQVVLVNFWATWCVPCRAEMPELDRAAEDYRAAGFHVLAVNVLEDAQAVHRFGEELQLGLPLLLDPRGEVYKAYNVQGLPTSFLIDQGGTIRDVKLGVVTRSYLDARLPKLLRAPDRS